MTDVSSMVDLGFISAKVPAGSHVCQIYSSDVDRTSALCQFLAKGLHADQSTACFSDKLEHATLRDWLIGEGLSIEQELGSGRLTCSGAHEVYFKDDLFDPDRMLGLLSQFYDGATSHHRSGARVIGEMSPDITKIPGGSRLFEYEARVNQLLQTRPVTAVCQYDARAFDGATIMDVLSVHPLMVVGNRVVQNPFYESAESYAAR